MKILIFILALLSSSMVLADETSDTKENMPSASEEPKKVQEENPGELELTDEERRSLDATSLDAEYGGSMGY